MTSALAFLEPPIAEQRQTSAVFLRTVSHTTSSEYSRSDFNLTLGIGMTMCGKLATSWMATVQELRLAADSNAEIGRLSRLNKTSDRRTLACEAVPNGMFHYQDRVREVMRDLAVAKHQPLQFGRRQTDTTHTASDREPLSKFLRVSDVL